MNLWRKKKLLCKQTLGLKGPRRITPETQSKLTKQQPEHDWDIHFYQAPVQHKKKGDQQSFEHVDRLTVAAAIDQSHEVQSNQTTQESHCLFSSEGGVIEYQPDTTSQRETKCPPWKTFQDLF